MIGENVMVCLQNNSSQKCYIPLKYFALLNIKIGDYVTIRCNSNIFLVNRVYSQTDGETIVAGDMTIISNIVADISYKKYSICFPKDVIVKSTCHLQKVRLKVFFKDFKSLSKWRNFKQLHQVLSQILQFGILSGCFIKLKDHVVAKEFGIHCVFINDTFVDKVSVGKITNETEIDICHLTTIDHLRQIQNFAGLQLGGLNCLLSLMKTCLLSGTFTKILITGPPGCGKTKLVEKLSSDVGAYLLKFQYSQLGSKSFSEWTEFFELISKFEASSSISCIILLENVDSVSRKSKETSKILYLLLSILELTTEHKTVAVIGTAVSSKHVLPELRTLDRFHKEFHIGVPTLTQREDIFNVVLNSLKATANVGEIAKLTPGYVGSDIESLCNKAFQISENKNFPQKNLTTQDFKDALKMFGQPSLLKNSVFAMKVHPENWEDIGGMAEIKQRLVMMTEWPLTHPMVFVKSGLPCPRGLLLFGPPGCCKTTLVRVLATQCSATFFSASPAQIYSLYVGDSEKSVIELFNEARLCSPSIIFLDEIDKLVGRRSYDNKHRGVQEKVLSALLNEMDGFGNPVDCTESESEDAKNGQSSDLKSNEMVIVVGATNRIDCIDDALLRPGRFDTILYIPPPNLQQRQEILKVKTIKMPLSNVDLKWIAERTEYYSGADLKNLCRIAALSASKSRTNITQGHFESALKISRPSVTRKQLEEYERLADKYSLAM